MIEVSTTELVVKKRTLTSYSALGEVIGRELAPDFVADKNLDIILANLA